MRITRPNLEEICEFLCTSAVEVGGLLVATQKKAKPSKKEVGERERGDSSKEAFADVDIDSQNLLIWRDAETINFDHCIIAEEETDIPPRLLGQKQYAFVYDGLDGTKNFSEQTHVYGVCLGFMDGDEFKVGVVYLPRHQHLYFAIDGIGAFYRHVNRPVNKDEPCKLGDISDKKIIAVSSKTLAEVLDEIKYIGFQPVMHRCSAYSVAQILDREINAHSTIKSNVWDIGPGFFIVEQAGGVLTDLQGRHFKFERGENSQIGKAQYFAFDSAQTKDLLLPIFEK